MADDEKKRLPTMGASAWWTLRKKLRGKIPAKITPSYLASALDMSQDSASTNVLPSLRITGLIDDDGKPTDRAVRWRDDAQYPQVCKEMKEEIYPQELLDLAPDSDVEKSTVHSWVANQLRLGDNAASKIAAFYVLLSEADVAKETGKPVKSQDEGRGKPKAPPRSTSSASVNSVEQTRSTKTNNLDTAQKQPSLHINIHIHLSPESSSNQIDQVFASMSKHLSDATEAKDGSTVIEQNAL